MDVGNEKNPFATFKELLISSGVLTEKDAEIYIAIIYMGQACATDVHKRLVQKTKFKTIAPQTVYKLLENLRTKGFIKGTVSSGRRAHSKMFTANPPEEPLEAYFNANDKLRDATNDAVALFEKTYEAKGNKDNDQNLWVSEPHKTAIREGTKILQSAEKSILMYSNNYSWIQHEQIADVLREKMADGIRVSLLGAPAADSVKGDLACFNKIRRETSIPCMPYCLVDGKHLLMVFNEGSDAKLLATRNKYMVDHYSAQFDKIWKKYSKGGVIDV